MNDTALGGDIARIVYVLTYLAVLGVGSALEVLLDPVAALLLGLVLGNARAGRPPALPSPPAVPETRGNMSQPIADTWYARDLPVLRAVVELSDQNRGRAVGRGTLESRLEGSGLTAGQIDTALRALAGEGFFAVDVRGDGRISMIGAPNGDARREAGTWPPKSPEVGAERMIAVLERIAENGTEEERSRAHLILKSLAGSGKQIATSVAAAIITGQLG